MVAYIHSTTPAAGFDRVRVPGEPELESEALRRRDGIPIDENSWQGIVEAATKAGVPAAEVPA
jgi:uncharacterized oxidoreductase